MCLYLDSGKYCESKTEFCSLVENPCNSQGTCVERAGGYECQCLPGFTGKNCSRNMDDCEGHMCQVKEKPTRFGGILFGHPFYFIFPPNFRTAEYAGTS